MKRNTNYLLLLLLVLSACGNGQGGNHSEPPIDSAAAVSSSASNTVAAATSPGVTSKMIKTANFNCRVQNVLSVVTRLEQIVKSAGGSVSESNVTSTSAETQSIPYQSDSLKQVQSYTTTAHLTLQVPAAQLDSVVNAIPAMVSFIDSRNIAQTDAGLKYLSNEMKNDVENSGRVKPQHWNIPQTAASLANRQYDDARNEVKTDRTIENLRILGNVQYATLTVSLTQPEQIFIQIIPNTAGITRIPFTAQCSEAFSGSMEIIKAFAIGMMYAWPVLLLIFVIVVVCNKYRKERIARLLAVMK